MTASTDPLSDFLATLNAMRVEMDLFALAVAKRVVTVEERERMASLFEDFGGVIRLSVQTRQIGEAIGETDAG